MDFLTPLDSLDNLDSDYHPLLEPKPQPYSNMTVRRAFIVWLRCGQKNQFRDVCDYYHRLEALEEQMSASMRAASRNHEFSLFTNPPPTSPYLQMNFPHLYSSPSVVHQGYPHAYLQNYFTVVEQKKSGVIIEEIIEEKDELKDKKVPTKIKTVTDAEKAALSNKEIFESSQVFRSDCKFEEMKQKNRIALAFAKLNTDILKLNDGIKTEGKNKVKHEENESTGTSKKDIVETSQLIKSYCTNEHVSLHNFLENFKEHATRCELTDTVTNIGCYIKRKMVQAELGLAVKVYRAKVYNNGNKESRFKTLSLPTKVKPTNQGTLNIDNDALVSGFAKLSMQITKINANNEPNGEVSTARMFGVKETNTDKKISLLKRDDIEVIKNDAGFSNTHLANIDTVICRKI